MPVVGARTAAIGKSAGKLDERTGGNGQLGDGRIDHANRNLIEALRDKLRRSCTR
jgi:hypothetical protein